MEFAPNHRIFVFREEVKITKKINTASGSLEEKVQDFVGAAFGLYHFLICDVEKTLGEGPRKQLEMRVVGGVLGERFVKRLDHLNDGGLNAGFFVADDAKAGVTGADVIGNAVDHKFLSFSV